MTQGERQLIEVQDYQRPARQSDRPGLLTRWFKADRVEQWLLAARRDHEDAPFSIRLMHALNVGLELDPGAYARVPSKGPLVIVANRPFGGIVEGVVLSAMLRRLRGDVTVLSRGAWADVPELESEWIGLLPTSSPGSVRQNEEAWHRASACLDKGGALVVFPGALDSHGWSDVGGDARWDARVWSLATRSKAHVVPVRVHGRGRWVDGRVARLHPGLSLLALLRETIECSHRTLRATVGDPITPAAGPEPGRLAIERLRRDTLALHVAVALPSRV